MIAFKIFPACIVQWALQRLQAIMICIVIHATVHCALCCGQVKTFDIYYHCYYCGHWCCCYFQIGHFCAFVPQFGSMIHKMIHKTQDEPLSLMMSQFVSEFIS